MRVLIADDHEPVRRGLRALLSVLENFDVCGEAVNGEEAISKANELTPDVVVMDFSMPVLDGIAASREIRRILPKTQIIMLSQYEAPEIMKEAFGAGVDTYVTKTAIWPKLVPALRRVQRGDSANGDGAAENVDANLQESIEQSQTLEQSLRESEERFRSTFEQSAVGMAHVSADGRWIRVNQKLCDMVGYSKTEIENLTVYDVTHPADVPADLARARKLAAGEMDHSSSENRLIRKDGQIVPVRVTVNAVRDHDGTLKYSVRVAEDARAARAALATLTDLTRNLQFAEGHLELISTTLATPLSRCSRDFRYVWMNEAYAKWLRRPANELIGQRIMDVVGAEAFQTLKPRFEQVLRGEDVAHESEAEFERIGKRRISAAYKPTPDGDGMVYGWLELLQDITDARDAGAKLN